MSNMSYCRFQNTLNDLQDCADNMDNEKLSTEEKKARKRLVRLCHDIVCDWYDEEADVVISPDRESSSEPDDD